MIYGFNGVTLPAGAANHAIAVGDHAVLAHWNTRRWSRIPTQAPATRRFWGVWAAGLDSIFTVGDYGTIVLTDTTREFPVGSPSAENLRAVWGRTAHDVYAVGDFGTILHWDGATWQSQASADHSPLFAVAGSSDSVYAAGQNGTLLRRTSTRWVRVPVPTTRLLSALSVSPARAVAAGNAGILLWRSATGWASAPALPVALITGVALTPDGAVATSVDGDLYDYDGTSWRPVPTPAGLATNTPLWSVDARGGMVFVVGNAGAAQRQNGVWQSATEGIEQLTYDSWTGESTNPWVSGTHGLIFHREGGAWRRHPTPTGSNLVAIWGSGSSPDTVFAVGAVGCVVATRGSGWVIDRAGTPLDPDLWAIDGTSGTDVWTVGGSGTVLHRGAAGWSSPTRPANATLRGVWVSSRSVVWAVGDGGLVLRRGYDLRWRTVTTPATPALYDVTGFTDANSIEHVYTVGEAGTVWEWTGTAWRVDAPAVGSTLRAVAIGRGRTVYAVGDNGTVIALKNGTWRTVPTPYASRIRSIRAAPDFQLYITGGNEVGDGLLARYGPDG